LDSDEITVARSIISNGEEIIIFDPITDTIEFRFEIDEEETPFSRLFAKEAELTRINLSMN